MRADAADAGDHVRGGIPAAAAFAVGTNTEVVQVPDLRRPEMLYAGDGAAGMAIRFEGLVRAGSGGLQRKGTGLKIVEVGSTDCAGRASLHAAAVLPSGGIRWRQVRPRVRAILSESAGEVRVHGSNNQSYIILRNTMTSRLPAPLRPKFMAPNRADAMVTLRHVIRRQTRRIEPFFQRIGASGMAETVRNQTPRSGAIESVPRRVGSAPGRFPQDVQDIAGSLEITGNWK